MYHTGVLCEGMNWINLSQDRDKWWTLSNMVINNISIDKVDKSKHNKTLLRYKESKERQHVSALYYKAIVRSYMEN